MNAAPLVIHSLFCPLSKSDPLPRDDSISKSKLQGEGTPDERKIVLGWMLDTRRFRIHLPTEKDTEWISKIKQLLKAPTVSVKDLESTIGRLNHAGHIIP